MFTKLLKNLQKKNQDVKISFDFQEAAKTFLVFGKRCKSVYFFRRNAKKKSIFFYKMLKLL